MDIQEIFKSRVRTLALTEPDKCFSNMVFGYNAFHFYTKHFPKKHIAKGYARLEELMMRTVAKGLKDPENLILGSIYLPGEITEAMGLRTLSLETLASYMAHGYNMEKILINEAENRGVASSLCSYHKAFLGAAFLDLLPEMRGCAGTSLACDGNLLTLRALHQNKNVPFYYLDVPQGMEEASVKYLADQLKAFTAYLTEITGKPFSLEKLQESVFYANETHKELLKFFRYSRDHIYPGELIHQMYMMLAVHMLAGSRDLYELIKFMNAEIQTMPPVTGKKILWVHVVPFYQETLKKTFNASKDYGFLASDIICDYLFDMDPEKPFESIARRMIGHAFNGTMSNKVEILEGLSERYAPDGIINFCHWGCKQAFGGSGILKAADIGGVPFLNLDGDGIDARNSHDGQLKTRLEAFLEIV